MERPTRQIIVALAEIIDSDTEQWLDLLEALFLLPEEDGYCSDIHWTLVGIDQEQQAVVLDVTATIEEML